MEEKDVVIVENKGNKGNPNHEPAGSPKGGQFASAPSVSLGINALGGRFNNFVKLKKEGEYVKAYSPTEAYKYIEVRTVGYSSEKLKRMNGAFNTGTLEAKEMVTNFFRDVHGITIRSGNACYIPKEDRVCFRSEDLLVEELDKYHEPGETFYHEIMHAIDYKYGSITTKYKLSNGKTLQETYHGEIAEKKYTWNHKMINEIKNDFKASWDEEIRKDFSEEEIEMKEKEIAQIAKKISNLESPSIKDFPSYQMYKEAYNKYSKEFDDNFKLMKEIEKYKETAYMKTCQKYSALSDMCCYIYKMPMSESICGGHPKTYWKIEYGDVGVRELFAELGSAWARGRKENIERVRKYFPETVKAFEELIGKVENIRKEKYGNGK